jgi:glucose/arabinose dehydrogenase/mono/diheme cytochrome c family protein
MIKLPVGLVCIFLYCSSASESVAGPLVRVAAQSLKLPSSSPAYEYRAESALGGITFLEPTQVVFAPGETGRVFVVEREGRVAVVPDKSKPVRQIFLDLSARVGAGGPDRGLLSLAFHPRFATNGFFYLWYSMTEGTSRYIRLARFRISSSDSSRADPTSETPLITQRSGPGGHDGGAIAFGPDGYLYLSIGDGDSGYAPAVESHQRIDRDFFGGIIRIDVDQRPENLAPNLHPSVHPGTYRVPADNPFVGASKYNGTPVASNQIRTEFWATGLRNPFRLAFDEATGALWCADVGLDLREEINLITRGGNYGWDFREGSVKGPSGALLPQDVTFAEPVFEYDHSLGLSITGGMVYRGARFEELQGRYIYGDFVSGRIWALANNDARPLSAARTKQIAVETGIVGFTTDPENGDVLMADLDSNMVKRLVSVPAGPSLPATLSLTGVFSNVAALTPAPGMVGYAPNVSFWSDHAVKSRWFGLPDLTTKVGFRPEANWLLPAGAVWVKHFDLEKTRGDAGSAVRVETRILVKTDEGVYGLSYRWNDSQTEAHLVSEEGADQTFVIRENGVLRNQSWRFPGRAQCLQCHTAVGGYALSFNTRQLNRVPEAGMINQITSLANAGYFDVAKVDVAGLPALAAAENIFASIETRARSYLDANCSQCHQPGGLGRGKWDARFSTPTVDAAIVGGALVDNRDVPARRVLVPGDESHSMLVTRLRDRGALRMPPIASSELDVSATALLSAWISQLAQRPNDRLINLAARALAGVDSETLTSGIVVSGGSKKVLIRAIGPSLAQFGVPNPLSEPTLTLRGLGSEAVIGNNVRWGGTPSMRAAFASTGAFPLADDSRDAALLVTLSPGAYTVQATSSDRTTGVALIETYDADTGSSESRLANSSIRARVGANDEILIPGLTIGGHSPRTILIRAAGPALSRFGVRGELTHPILKLFDGAVELASNRAWQAAPNLPELRSATIKAGAFEFEEGSKDCALLVTLPPGGYTIQVAGADSRSGVVLVEVYEVR